MSHNEIKEYARIQSQAIGAGGNQTGLAKPRESRLDSTIASAEKALQSLSIAVAQLEGRLLPVLDPSPNVVTIGAGGGLQNNAAFTRHTDRLLGHAEKIEGIRSRLESILARLDV